MFRRRASVIAPRVQEFLDEHRICYETLPHLTDFTAQETAEHTHTPGDAFAKAVIIETERGEVMLVLPADHEVELDRVERALRSSDADLVPENRLKRIFRDCDRGAIPPFGNLYGLEVFAAPTLLQNPTLTFNAGSHEMAIRMSRADYVELVDPLLLDFSHHV